MIIEQTPTVVRAIYPGAIWRLPRKQKTVYLTFDDGPIPEVTPWVLEVLGTFGIKATFFCVGDNVRKHPEVFRLIKEGGHQVGNHSFNHLQGYKHFSSTYVKNVEKADELIGSKLFRPPHGHLRYGEYIWLKKKNFKIVLWDVITRDYNPKLNGDFILNNVKKYARNGSIIVFHDSLKAEASLRYALPKAIESLLSEGYIFDVISDEAINKSKEENQASWLKQVLSLETI